MDKGNITVSTYHGIATVSFHHPKSNSLPSNLIIELTDSINKFAVDKDVRVIILRSAALRGRA